MIIDSIIGAIVTVIIIKLLHSYEKAVIRQELDLCDKVSK